jgi:hypothetical protein
MLLLIFIISIVALFFVFNSIIWLKDKKIKNINDKIIKYIIYANFVIISGILIYISYLYYFNLRLKIVN